jgi:hypothetical protein
MTKEFFERHYAMLSDYADATEVFGNSIEPKVATVAEIRRKLEGHSNTAILDVNADGSGFSVTEVQKKTSATWR